jgi:hypothetical protein
MNDEKSSRLMSEIKFFQDALIVSNLRGNGFLDRAAVDIMMVGGHNPWKGPL